MNRELSSAKPSGEHSAPHRVAGRERGGDTAEAACLRSCLRCAGEGCGWCCSSSDAARRAVLSKDQELDQEILNKGAREQLLFVLGVFMEHGVDRFDLSAPDRIEYVKDVKGVEVLATKNVLMRWTYRRADGRRENSPKGVQGAFNLTSEEVVVEFDRSMPPILRDFDGPKRGGIAPATLGRDVYWRAHADGKWRVILLDDIDPASLPACRRLVFQTSAKSYQSFLFLDTEMDMDGRYLLQRHFARHLGIGDTGATSGDRFGRIIRSLNRKPSRDAFETRLYEARLDLPVLCVADVMDESRRLAGSTHDLDVDAVDGLGEVVVAATEAGSNLPPSGLLKKRAPAVGSHVRTDFTESADDFSLAMSMHRRGCGDHEVIEMLVQSARGRGKLDPTGYARLTLNRSKIAVSTGGVLPPATRRKSNASS